MYNKQMILKDWDSHDEHKYLCYVAGVAREQYVGQFVVHMLDAQQRGQADEAEHYRQIIARTMATPVVALVRMGIMYGYIRAELQAVKQSFSQQQLHEVERFYGITNIFDVLRLMVDYLEERARERRR